MEPYMILLPVGGLAVLGVLLAVVLVTKRTAYLGPVKEELQKEKMWLRRGEYNAAMVKGRQNLELLLKLVAEKNGIQLDNTAQAVANAKEESERRGRTNRGGRGKAKKVMTHQQFYRWLSENGYLDRVARWEMNQVRIIGNKAVHENFADKDDAWNQYNYLEDILKTVTEKSQKPGRRQERKDGGKQQEKKDGGRQKGKKSGGKQKEKKDDGKRKEKQDQTAEQKPAQTKEGKNAKKKNASSEPEAVNGVKEAAEAKPENADHVRKRRRKKKPQGGQKAQGEPGPQDGRKAQVEPKAQGTQKVKNEKKPQGGQKAQAEPKAQGDQKAQSGKKPQGGQKMQDEKKTQSGKKPQDGQKTQNESKPQNEQKAAAHKRRRRRKPQNKQSEPSGQPVPQQ